MYLCALEAVKDFYDLAVLFGDMSTWLTRRKRVLNFFWSLGLQDARFL